MAHRKHCSSQLQVEGSGVGWVGLGGVKASPGRLGPQTPPYLCVSTGQVGSLLAGHNAYRTGDRPRTLRWHTQEEDVAVPVCMWCARCLCVLGVRWRGSEAHRVTRLCRAWPSPGSAGAARGGAGFRAVVAVLGLWGGGG